ncbi:hypothetical protein ACFQU7_08495 [Pseudoroseomonas wenyumeiae]
MPDAAAMPLPNSRERLVGLLCALGVTLCWAGFSLASRLSAKQPFTPWDVAALRYSGGLVVGLLLASAFGWPRLSFRRALALMAGAAFGFPLASYLGFRFAPTSHGVVIMTGSLPFVTTALATFFLGERWDRQKLLSSRWWPAAWGCWRWIPSAATLAPGGETCCSCWAASPGPASPSCCATGGCRP